MKVIIPCAGYATRLYPLTEKTPKTLLEVKNKPILEYVLEKVGQVGGISEIFIVSNNRFLPKFLEWKIKSTLPKAILGKVKIMNDNTNSNEDRLGTIGDIWYAIEKEKIDDELFVILGDNLFDFDLRKAKKIFDSTSNSTIVGYDVKEKSEARKLGNIELEENSNKVKIFVEKPNDPKSTLAAIGLYLFKKNDLEQIENYVKDENLSNDMMGDLIKYLVDVSGINAIDLNGRWFDIGSKETYEEANETW